MYVLVCTVPFTCVIQSLSESRKHMVDYWHMSSSLTVFIQCDTILCDTTPFDDTHVTYTCTLQARFLPPSTILCVRKNYCIIFVSLAAYLVCR